MIQNNDEGELSSLLRIDVKPDEREVMTRSRVLMYL